MSTAAAVRERAAQDAEGSSNDSSTSDALSAEHKRALIDAALQRARAARTAR